ncbi:MAG: hypothetical protein AAF936_08570 [Pseudomonadota bacterium]
MTKTPSGINGAPRSGALPPAPVGVADRMSGAGSLHGQISAETAAAQPFQQPQHGANPAVGSADNNANALAPQDFAASLPAETEKYFTCFMEARKFAKNMPTIPYDPKMTLAAARLRRSQAAVQTEQNAAAQGFHKTSVQARAQKAAILPNDQRRFFEEFAARSGYETAETSIDDETLLRNWKQYCSGELNKSEFIAPFRNLPEEQRYSIALNLARLVALDQSRDFPDEADPFLLKDEAITNGGFVIETLFALPVKGAPSRQNAFRSWNPCKDEKDLDNISAVFYDACVAYNTRTEPLTQLLEKKSALPLLGMPLELRGGALARKVHNQEQQKFLKSSGLAEPETLGELAVRALKSIGVILSFPFIIPWFFSSYRAFAWPILSSDERDRLANEYATQKQLPVLTRENRRLAEEWVKNMYSNAVSNRAGGLQNEPHDPHGLFAAILNPDETSLTSDFLARNKLVEDVKEQLYLAAQCDILAAQTNAPPTDLRTTIDGDAYLKDPSYLQAIAESIVDGMVAGLQWSAQQHRNALNSSMDQTHEL